MKAATKNKNKMLVKMKVMFTITVSKRNNLRFSTLRPRNGTYKRLNLPTNKSIPSGTLFKNSKIRNRGLSTRLSTILPVNQTMPLKKALPRVKFAESQACKKSLSKRQRKF